MGSINILRCCVTAVLYTRRLEYFRFTPKYIYLATILHLTIASSLCVLQVTTGR